MKDVLYIDVETTGVDAEDRLVQAAYKFESNGQEITQASYFKPPLPVKLVAMSVNNITNRMLGDKDSFADSSHKSILTELAKEKIFVAHNAVFDLGMLAKEGITVERNICTMKLAHYVDKDCLLEKHNLSYLRYFYDVDVEANPHEAIGDITILEAVFKKLYDELAKSIGLLATEEAVIEKMLEISSKPTLYRKFNFGKYMGLTVREVAEGGPDGKGRSWMQWLLAEKLKAPFGTENDWIYTLDYYLQAYSPTR